MRHERLARLGTGALFAIFAALAGGCGYHFAAEGSGLPPQAKTIYVNKFANHSRYTGIEDQFQRYMKDDIANHKRLELVDDPSGADLVLNGEFTYIATAPIATNAVSEPIDYNLVFVANAVLTDGHTHDVIWRSGGISSTQSYAMVAPAVVTTSPMFLQQNLRSQDIANMPDLQVAKSQRDFSEQQSLQSLAESIYDSMAEGF